MHRVLFIAMHRPDRSPSQRFRFEQYFGFLEANGFPCDFSWLISGSDDRIFYSPGNYFSKFSVMMKSAARRYSDVSAANRYDIVFVQREAFMTGSTWFERKISRSRARFIFDFDDSIWLANVSDANKELEWLKNYEKTSKIIAMADAVFAGNDYLAGYALQFNPNVKIIPTTIDTDKYVRKAKRDDGRLCIGWSGSITTIQHFQYAVPILTRIREKYGEKVWFKLIGDSAYVNEQLGIHGVDWNKEAEIADLSEFDIGIMPLPDNEWAKGKCGLKGLQYMALEIPAVMSPVGVNTKIISDGNNGFLADGVDEWVEKISRLIDSPGLRQQLGAAGRQTVVEQYSVAALQQKYLDLFREVLRLRSGRKRKILYVAAHRPDRSPGQRFRFEQYINHLEANDFEITYSYLIDERDDAVFYRRGHYFKKTGIILKSLVKRLRDTMRANEFDVVVVYREAIMLGSTFFELLLRRSKARMVLDFDDAIWLYDVSEGNIDLGWLKRPAKTARLIRMAHMVFAGNRYLADYARRFNGNVKVVPTTVNTGYHRKRSVQKGAAVCIGWTGSSTTLKHLDASIPVLKKLKEKYGHRVTFRVIADVPFVSDGLNVDFVKWNRGTEIEDLSAVDIGIMPLPDDEWSRGKCGFKGLQYMALEIPAVISPVGVNSEIVQDGVNGFLARNETEWMERLSLLIESEELRTRLGRNGRKTVEEKYSLDSQKDVYLNYLKELIGQDNGSGDG